MARTAPVIAARRFVESARPATPPDRKRTGRFFAQRDAPCAAVCKQQRRRECAFVCDDVVGRQPREAMRADGRAKRDGFAAGTEQW